MLYYDSIDVSKGIYVNKNCIEIVWYLSLLVFLGKGFVLLGCVNDIYKP